MKKMLLLFVILILLSLLAVASINCRRKYGGDLRNPIPWSMVHHGMNIAEVLDIMGPPHVQLGDSTRLTIFYQAHSRQNLRKSTGLYFDQVVIVFTNGYVEIVAPGYKLGHK